jgi:PPOX class probable F420-dependent enzyme
MLGELSPAERDAFLSKPIVGVLVTLRADGDLLLSPLWHEWVDESFFFVIGNGDVKCRHLTRHPQVSYAVLGQLPPYPGVEAHGHASVVETGPPANRRMARIARHYVGEERASAFLQNLGPDDLVSVRLRVRRLRTFDQRDVAGLGFVAPGQAASTMGE